MAIIHDLAPYDRILETLARRTRTALNASSQVVSRHYSAWSPQGFVRTFVNLDREIIGVNQSRGALARYFQEYKLLNGTHRSKRAILPFVGQISSFLFGTVSETDLGAIRRNIQLLRTSQLVMSHVATEALTMLNASQMEISINRQAINSIVSTLQTLDSRLVNITRSLAETVNRLETFTQLYLRLDLAVEELKQGLRTMGFYLQHLHLQLNMLSLGRLSPSTITPSSFISLLQGIRAQLPPSLKLPLDPLTQIWDFYRILSCEAILEHDKIIVLIFIPLLDSSHDFEIFEAHSLPIPMEQEESGQKIVRSLLAEYELEAKAIAVNKERSKYVLLHKDEIKQCVGTLASHCAMRSPIYPINLSQFCIVSIFMRNEEKKRKNCQTIVRSGDVLPMAEYLSSGVWIITTRAKLQFSIICHGGQSPQEKIVQPPIDILRLPMTCTATNDHLSLPAYYQFDSVNHIHDEFLEELQSQNFTSVDLWGPVHTALPKFNFSKIPPKLQAVKRIAIEPFISELRGIQAIELEKESFLPQWVYIVIACVAGVIIGIGLVAYLYWKRRRGAVRGERRGGRESHDGREESTPALTVAALSTARRELLPPALDESGIKEPSAPLLVSEQRTDRETAAAAVESIIKRLYPTAPTEPV